MISGTVTGTRAVGQGRARTIPEIITATAEDYRLLGDVQWSFSPMWLPTSMMGGPSPPLRSSSLRFISAPFGKSSPRATPYQIALFLGQQSRPKVLTRMHKLSKAPLRECRMRADLAIHAWETHLRLNVPEPEPQ